ncbi:MULTISPECIES: hypothetical protein [Campylobacter]|uniref:hypothetical protein n=1 Tax=Campylobacter TaxID=194 RepID=UPI000A3514AE|nr:MULTISPECIES: hypothetical protein [unclassified Campylobacter]MCR8678749.1 hypothetical protein [Campylobacter sp. RM19072]MEE3704546.1 hypothetical protein [Campylobacter sp. CX2-8023-23]
MGQNYKDIAIKLFKQGKFELAKMSFNIAYNRSPSDEILAFIELCDTAKDNPSEALSLFEIYFDPAQKDNTQTILEIIELIQNANDESAIMLESQNAITYADFKNLLNDNDFKELFESILFSTKIIITHKDELFDLVNSLVDNGFSDIGLKYLESSVKMFMGDERVAMVLQKIRDKDENSLK